MSHLAVPQTYPCAFCDYLHGARPFTILHREDLAAVLVTREQRGASHLLVVTTRHAPTILDLREAESHAVMKLLKRSAAAIDAADQRPGISVWQNNGVDAHQKIPHFHFHVASTVEGGGTEWDEVREMSIPETDHIADRLRPYF
ncbi:histidine triad (HIT) family protein [Streptomyces pratensis]|jgi:histidine triad (HIT) family protein|nr:histidine triad (HIT) family protein [Streptomyces pratensis]